ncbi:alpha-1,6-mannosyl-glycoprotein 4-beta-N-acetylglucosaminyltransferase-like [Hemicordylus capensis]|uniref:alpha-1,6-mannosyl-glycoprotein 4-beta-N-acetylglucosaminyltransferase-like n=1 Tax=Hemicordylus capensis TaxID=884348 RepID=UPI0023045989|nr:alpha-1,6-mannosyl-glycoprotein 4-beta-N-acetylglucosaminyltransferase-like [Hemicordylus capensis]XP_053106852.1 alpha-1,6-mannosyl-glycoprotein 4-beta-N-acetylglucosaminyltransferase-like [Hemicordylus capensis]XP_053106853.1 alpha-1,6-mannosyl-glycoprotein 4-beta-N-acetylglucosaminyltransferase-like [Hemicordylus capensis]XP_053106854.1 alpha-1,6-mannosyl-glycoprotein 4-beta-N-acetylglucosaminyltransferase-like [Hemicordylus capensis]XP_053106855.1 alpha-1,6-mannosyl-glycoprotein 4-beta-N
MRCFLRRSLVAAILLLVVILLFMNLLLWTQEDPGIGELRQWAQDIGLQELHADWNLHSLQKLGNATNLLNVSYRYLAGIPPLQKKLLTVGLCSVKRKRENYLLETLRSVFEQSTQEELKEMVVVVHLADPDQEWNNQVVENIGRRFALQLLLGHLLVIHAPFEHYPPLEGLKRNFNDAEERVRFRSKQNVDYAYLMNFAANLSTYYLMIEDDVRCSKSFFSAIKRVLASQELSYWVTLEFSKLGYIGKLYHSSDLPRLARFLILFYQEMPCDWLLVHFRLLLTQKEVIRFKPSLFQHVGHYSSFQGTANRLKDEDFEEDPNTLPDNPPADMITDIHTFENYLPSKAYSNTEDYFWGKAPSTGNSFTLVFKQPAHIFCIRIHTGSKQRQGDYLRAGLVQLGTQKKRGGRGCATFISVGVFVQGQFDRQGLENSTASPPECVRILVTASQNEWLIISSISIWTKPSL